MPSFLAPLFLLGVAAAAVPIVLHLLKRQPEHRVKFAAVRLLKNAPVERTNRRRLRELLLLALRVTALVLLALAFARPFFTGQAAGRSTGVTIVALDTSMSLSAPGQFERAQQLARDAIAAVPATELVGVVTFSGSVDVAAPPSPDRTLATSAVDRARAGAGTTRYRPALTTAVALIEERSAAGTVVVVTDLQAHGWRDEDKVATPSSITVEVADVGPPPSNLAITAVRAAPRAITATVRNGSGERRDIPVRLAVDGRVVGQATARVDANAVGEVTVPAPTGLEGVVSIEDVEGVALDNTRYVLLGGASRSVVVLTSNGSLARDAFYVQQALLAGAQTALKIDGLALSDLANVDAARINGASAMVVLSTRGLDRRGRELVTDYVTRGGGLLLSIGPDVDPLVAQEILDGVVTIDIESQAGRAARPIDRRLVPADLRHPIFRAFGSSGGTLGSIGFDRVARVATTRSETCQVLARFTTGEPALVECTRGQGRVLVFASDLGRDWNDFPRHASFVAFLHEAVNYLSANRERTNEYLVDDRPAGLPAEPGFVTRAATTAGENGQRVAINVDPEEAVNTRLTTDAFRTALVPAAAAGQRVAMTEASRDEARQQLWWYVFLAMLLVLAAEGWVGARTA